MTNWIAEYVGLAQAVIHIHVIASYLCMSGQTAVVYDHHVHEVLAETTARKHFCRMLLLSLVACNFLSAARNVVGMLRYARSTHKGMTSGQAHDYAVWWVKSQNVYGNNSANGSKFVKFVIIEIHKI